ncbi:hypothetical protein RDWZM_006646 [Blomia tropicalis]|uniref:Uncharacterized protein n=1 Tax=Blomia tropicalis TaxID=40697 RepID=A0A9Q0M8N0_BLOTA|nr:hypothetical protein RDWZM_006646 [Blomia tropicalis]
MSNTVSRTWKIIKPHVPMITFKKGGRTNQMTSTAASKSNMVSKVAVHVSTIKDESMLPKKYIRKPIDQIEMQIVELGGAHIS